MLLRLVMEKAAKKRKHLNLQFCHGMNRPEVEGKVNVARNSVSNRILNPNIGSTLPEQSSISRYILLIYFE